MPLRTIAPPGRTARALVVERGERMGSVEWPRGQAGLRLLPFLDWAAIARHPKALIGCGDTTGLLLALHAKTGLVTFHGAVGASQWNAFNLDWMKRILWNGEAAT